MPGHVEASTTAPALAPLEPEAAPDAPLDDPELEPDDPLLDPLFDDPVLEPLFDDPLLEPLFDDPELPLDTVLAGGLEAHAPGRVKILNAPREASTRPR
jgi:hypothetical protein